jgi:HSP20 family protein
MAAQKPKDDLFDDALDDDFLNDDDDSANVTVPATQDDFFEDTEVPGQLAVDVYQTDEAITVVAPVPGVSKNDIELSIVENTLTVQGKRHADKQIKNSDYFVQECYWGEFSRSIILPVQIKEEEAEAELKDGMLTITIPKAAQEKVKKITIKG